MCFVPLLSHQLLVVLLPLAQLNINVIIKHTVNMTKGLWLSSGVVKYVLTLVLLLIVLAGIKSYSITFLTRSIHPDRSSIPTTAPLSEHYRPHEAAHSRLIRCLLSPPAETTAFPSSSSIKTPRTPTLVTLRISTPEPPVWP